MRRRLFNGDTALALLLTIAGVYWMFAAPSYGFWEGFAPRTGFMPFIYGLLLAALSLTILVRGSLWPGADAQAESPGKPLMIILLAALALVGMETIGFAPAMFITLFVLFVAVERLAWLPAIVVSTVLAGGVLLLFSRWLGVPLPAGPLGI